MLRLSMVRQVMGVSIKNTTPSVKTLLRNKYQPLSISETKEYTTLSETSNSFQNDHINLIPAFTVSSFSASSSSPISHSDRTQDNSCPFLDSNIGTLTSHVIVYMWLLLEAVCYIWAT